MKKRAATFNQLLLYSWECGCCVVLAWDVILLIDRNLLEICVVVNGFGLTMLVMCRAGVTHNSVLL